MRRLTTFKNTMIGACILAGGAAIAVPAQSAVIFEDDFEASTLNAAPRKVMGAASWGNPVRTTVVSSKAKAGSKSLQFYYPGNTDLSIDSFSEQRFELGGQYRDVWIKYDLYIPDNYYHRTPVGSGNNKGLLMLWSGDYERAKARTSFHYWNNGTGDSTMSYEFTSNGVDSRHWGTTSAATINHKPASQGGDAGRWHEIIIHVKIADVNASNGVAEIWKNGVKILEDKGLPNWHSTANYFERGYLLGWSNSGFNQDTYFYIDNVKMGTTEADVKGGAVVTAPPAAPTLTLQ